MRTWSFLGSIVIALAVVLVPSQGAAPTAAAQGPVQIEWLGHMFFRLTSPNGVVVLTSPWLTNRDSPVTLDSINRADIILAPNSHTDDFGQAVEIANKTGGMVLTSQGLGEYMVARRDLNPGLLIGTAPGNTHTLHGITINIVRNQHDNTIRDEPTWDGGPAIGYFVTFENGFTVYFAASSAPIPEMVDYARAFRPDVALINASNNDALAFGDIAEHLLTGHPQLQTIIPTHRPAGALELFEYSFEVESRQLPVAYVTPPVGEPHAY